MANMALSEQILWENWCPVFPKGLIPHIFPVTLWLWLTVRHGIDGPNRNRWFTELKNGWIFPWRIRSSHNQMVLDGHRWGIHGYPLFTMSTILKPQLVWYFTSGDPTHRCNFGPPSMRWWSHLTHLGFGFLGWLETIRHALFGFVLDCHLDIILTLSTILNHFSHVRTNTVSFNHKV